MTIPRIPEPSAEPGTATTAAATPRAFRIPRATYRLQFHGRFGFEAARELVPYLAELGVSDLYASPLSQPRAGSPHGYDVCDPNRLNPALGSERAFDDLCQALKAHELGLLLDVVPNHMGIGDPANTWWVDVLEHGTASSFAELFDIEWRSPSQALYGKVLLPVLGRPYGEALRQGQLRLVRDVQGLGVAYFEHRFPLSPHGCSTVLAEAAAQLDAVSADHDALLCLKDLSTALDATRNSSLSKQSLSDSWASWKLRLAEGCRQHIPLDAALDAGLSALNGVAGHPATLKRLDALLRAEQYRLVWWRLASRVVNYRRFFDITHLVGVRVELPWVFLRTHELAARLRHEGCLSGLRVDHPDGLRDPEEYFRRLQRLMHEAAPGDPAHVLPDTRGRVFYVVAEKILSQGEPLPKTWPVQGSTGYDFLNLVNGIFVPTASASVFTRIYRDFVGGHRDFVDEVWANKRLVLNLSFRADLGRLARGLLDLTRNASVGWTVSSRQLREILAEVVAAYPIYRTYARSHSVALGAFEAGCVRSAFEAVRRRHPDWPMGPLRFLEELLLLGVSAGGSNQGLAREWILRFQQLTGPAMAKGLEDTTFYTFNRLLSLNEVGGDPGDFGVELADFHAANRRRAELWPDTMLATATHDTKRGEDLRARLSVLAEMPEDWERVLTRLRALHAPLKRSILGVLEPGPNEDYLLYQTLLGLGWPDTVLIDDAFRDRVETFMLKAVREAKVRTSWLRPDRNYEDALLDFLRAVLEPDRLTAAQGAVGDLASRLAWYGRFNSLAQTLLKLTAPGVPDLYQGSELWDLSLVDPDNRRPVDFDVRRKLLERLRAIAALDDNARIEELTRLPLECDGSAAKLWVIWRTLQTRRKHPELWMDGDYHALTASGSGSAHVVAFVRSLGSRRMVAVVARWPALLTGGVPNPLRGEPVWGSTALAVPDAGPGQSWQDVLTGASHSGGHQAVCDLLRIFPVALLLAVDAQSVDSR